MEAKYYTPKIEEFHLGFEYEFHGMTTGGLVFLNTQEKEAIRVSDPHVEIWTKEIFTLNPFFSRSISDIEKLIQSSQIRVKHLDREDIEELGFVVYSGFYEHGDVQQKFLKEDDNTLLLVMQNGDIVIQGKVDSNLKYLSLFRGKIKNKSELKRLMVQLGIIKE